MFFYIFDQINAALVSKRTYCYSKYIAHIWWLAYICVHFLLVMMVVIHILFKLIKGAFLNHFTLY